MKDYLSCEAVKRVISDSFEQGWMNLYFSSDGVELEKEISSWEGILKKIKKIPYIR